MPCFHPHRGWRQKDGSIRLGKRPADMPALEPIPINCTKCLGCRMEYARAWNLRCRLELNQHREAAFTTLTYSENHLPHTLSKRHFQLFIKRLRKNLDGSSPNATIRFFGCGEYGTQGQRPHYHAILFGLGERHKRAIDVIWGMGRTRTYAANPRTIAYTAGYTAKKLQAAFQTPDKRWEWVDQETGEVHEYQPPFLLMSRNPGLGSHAKQFTDSWRSHAVLDNITMPVPRYYHEAWKQQATQQDIHQLREEKKEQIKNKDRTPERLEIMEQIAINTQRRRAEQRNTNL